MAKVLLETQKRKEDKSKLFSGWMGEHKYKLNDVARILGCERKKAKRIYDDPERLTILELRALKMTDEERIALTR